MTACTSFLAFFAEQTLAFAEKCIPAPTAGRKSSDLQAVGQIRWQTRGLSTIRAPLGSKGSLLDSATSQEVALSEPPFGIKGRWHGVSRDGGIDKGDARLARL